jgi:hypothetical protein
MRRLELVLVLLVLVLAVSLAWPRHAWSPPSPHCREGPALAGVYHADRLQVRERCVVAAGVVTRVVFEEYDGDVHVSLRPDDPRLLGKGDESLVVEVIPQDRGVVPIPAVDARVTVVGPWVDDLEHGWREVHPAWWISAGRVVPASAHELAAVRALLRDGD